MVFLAPQQFQSLIETGGLIHHPSRRRQMAIGGVIGKTQERRHITVYQLLGTDGDFFPDIAPLAGGADFGWTTVNIRFFDPVTDRALQLNRLIDGGKV